MRKRGRERRLRWNRAAARAKQAPAGILLSGPLHQETGRSAVVERLPDAGLAGDRRLNPINRERGCCRRVAPADIWQLRMAIPYRFALCYPTLRCRSSCSGKSHRELENLQTVDGGH